MCIRDRAQVLHLIRDERDLELEDRARGRAHTGLQMGCLLLAALCYLQGDPAWTVLLALPLLGWSIHCFCRYAGDREPLFLAGGLLSGLPALLLGAPFLGRILGAGPLSPGRLAGFVLLAAVLAALSRLDVYKRQLLCYKRRKWVPTFLPASEPPPSLFIVARYT